MVENSFLGKLCVWRHTPDKSRARVLLVHGISEHSGRHLNTVNYLLSKNIECIRFDLRGAGKSGGTRQWIEHFSDYVEDVTQVFNWIQGSLPPLPLYVLGHSLGGAIAIYFSSNYGNLFQGLILSAPAYLTGSGVSPVKIHVGRFLNLFFPKLRIHGLEGNPGVSRDPEVCKAYKEDPLSFHFNTLQQGNEVLNAFKVLPEICKKISLPVFIAHGTSDTVILHAGSFTLWQALASGQKELFFLPNGYHEPHNDIDKDAYFQLLGTWLDRQLKTPFHWTPKQKE
jgi:alpha-beta hydrolase superfamily lysophospholipase